MDKTELYSGMPLDPSVVEQIRIGDWSPSVNDKLTQALLLRTGTEAQLCSQILRAACTVDSNGRAPDPETFGRGVSQWIEHCVNAIKNTNHASEEGGHTDHDLVRSRLAAALVETVWVLGVEWEPDTADDSDGRWRDEQLQHAEQNKALLRMTKALIASGVISPDLAKERLDADFLEQLGTIPSAVAFTRKYIRLNTTVNFKQTKFNLVSEQGEGFSKLVTLIQATMAAVVPHQISSDILRAVSDNPSAESCGSVVLHALRSLGDVQQRVRSLLVDLNRLIGVFNLDPNRVLDIILDCFMSSVRFYWPFYIALLDASPWCQSQADSVKVAQLIGWKLQFYINGPALDYKYMDELTTMAALLITHRLIRLTDLYSMLQPSTSEAVDKEYDAWQARQKEKQLGDAGGLLAKMGDLDNMKEVGEDNAAAATEEATTDPADRWANQHALLCAKLLAMGDTPSALVYMRRFLHMARIHQPLADLAVRIVDACTIDLYQRTDCVRAPVKPCLRLKTRIATPCADGGSDVDAWKLPRARDDGIADAHSQPNFVLTPLVAKTTDVFFYEKFWLLDAAKRMPPVSQVSDLPRVLAPWLNVAFLRLHESPALVTRLMRLCRYGLTRGLGEEAQWIGALRAWILPSISFSTSSAALSNELWVLVSSLPLAKRHELYGDWDSILTSGKPMLPLVLPEKAGNSASSAAGSASKAMSLDGALEGSDAGPSEAMCEVSPAGSSPFTPPYVEIEMLHHDVRRKVRSIMRRLSGDTVKLMGRQLCSLCHPSPTLSIKIILDQVCSYDNLVDSVVEAFRYLSPLDADVLFFVVLRILDDPTSAKLKDDGVNAAHWLQCLSLFIASFSHRHENQRLDVVLDYILKRTIRAVRTEGMPVPELVVLSDTILKLAAIDAMANATDEQTMALQGGQHLCNEAFSMISPWIIPQDATIETVFATNADNRLTKRMAMWLTNLIVNRGQALSFAVALSVHAEMVIKAASLPLSNVVAIYDREIERVYQLFHLMQSNLKPEKYAKLIPGPHTLFTKYGLSWGLAVLWGRPSVAIHLARGLKRWEEEGEKVHVEIVELDDSETGPEDGAAVDDAQQPTQPTGEVAAPQSKEEEEEELATHSPGQGSPAPQSPTLAKGKSTSPAMDVDRGSADRAQPKESRPVEGQQRVVASLKFEAPLLPRDFVDHFARTLPPQALAAGLSPEFVAVFWVLTSHDIDVPYERYEKEIEIQRSFIKRVDAVAKQSHSRSKTAQLTQIRSRASLAIGCLEKEMVEQRLHVSRVRKWLIAQKDYWFCMAPEQRKLIAQALLQHCILPRAILSASDASFCARFLWRLHFPLATNKFSLMIVYDHVFSDSLSTTLAALTENESRCYAKFLNSSLALLAPLHLVEAQYKERAVNAWRGLTGFQKYSRYKSGFLPPKSRTIRLPTPPDQTTDSGDALRILPGSTMLSHDDFRTVMRKWQVTLTKAFITTLDSERNDTVRNGILTLREMQKTFPVIAQHGRRILDKVTEIAEGSRSTSAEGAAGGPPDSNKNLKVLATSYGAYLGMAKKNWILESSYYPAQTKDSVPRSPLPSNTQPSGKPGARATVRAPESADGGGSPRGSRGERGDGRITPSTEGRPDKSHDERARPPARRPVLAGTVAMAAAAAAAAASTSTSVSPKAVAIDADGTGAASRGDRLSTHDVEQSRRPKGDGLSRTEDPGTDRDHDGRRYRDRDRGRQRDRQPGTDAHHPPLSADSNRRDSRSLRDSPVQLDREATHPEAHQQKRARDDSVSDSKLEPPRQRPATSTSMSTIREVSPAASGTRGSSALPPSGPLAAKSLSTKPTSEDADRKRKELRAQLIKQQEQKQKQKLKEDPPAIERRERGSPGDSGRHSSAERASAGESKDGGGGGGGRRDRRISSRLSGVNESHGQQQQQQQQPQHNSGRDGGLSSSGAFGRLGPSAQTHATPTQGRQQQQQQQQSRRQAQPDSVAQSNYVDRNSHRYGRGADGNRNHSPPSRDDRHALADEPASIRISSGRQTAKADLGRSGGGSSSGGGGGTTHRRGAGDARQSGENSDNNANGSRRGSKRGRGGGGEFHDWSDGGKRRRK